VGLDGDNVFDKESVSCEGNSKMLCATRDLAGKHAEYHPSGQTSVGISKRVNQDVLGVRRCPACSSHFCKKLKGSSVSIVMSAVGAR
jgi:hypothetical protein